jgi:hypothetical protein
MQNKATLELMIAQLEIAVIKNQRRPGDAEDQWRGTSAALRRTARNRRLRRNTGAGSASGSRQGCRGVSETILALMLRCHTEPANPDGHGGDGIRAAPYFP